MKNLRTFFSGLPLGKIMLLFVAGLFLAACGDDSSGPYLTMDESSSSIQSSGSVASSSSVRLQPCRTETEDNCEYGTITDERDGKTYKTVKIGNWIWMAENLNYDAGEGSYCYDDKEENCEKYGRLYTFDVANTVCPKDFYLASSSQYRILFDQVGADSSAVALKSDHGWEEDGNGLDQFGFSALPGGSRYYEGSYLSEGEVAKFMTCDKDIMGEVTVGLAYNQVKGNMQGGYAGRAAYVRCYRLP